MTAFAVRAQSAHLESLRSLHSIINRDGRKSQANKTITKNNLIER